MSRLSLCSAFPSSLWATRIKSIPQIQTPALSACHIFIDKTAVCPPITQTAAQAEPPRGESFRVRPAFPQMERRQGILWKPGWDSRVISQLAQGLWRTWGGGHSFYQPSNWQTETLHKVYTTLVIQFAFHHLLSGIFAIAGRSQQDVHYLGGAFFGHIARPLRQWVVS